MTLAASPFGFVASLNNEIRRFPPALQQSYAEIINQFQDDPSAKGFERMSASEGFTNSTLRGVAHRMYQYFPTHFFKFQDALLNWEVQCRKQNQAFLLDRQQVTFIDLGCGTGAASAAVLATLEQYHTFLQQQGVRVEAVRVNLVALDPVQAELDVYAKLIGNLASHLRLQEIHVSFQTICQRFPEGTPYLIEALSPLQGHVLLVGMSNLIRWIWNEADSFLERKQSAALEQLQPHEIQALQTLAEQTNFDLFHVLGVATKSKGSPWWLPEKLSFLLTKLAEQLRLVERPFGKRWRKHAEVAFENPKGSYYERQSHQKHNPWKPKSRYFVENLLNIAPKYHEDESLQQILSSKTLEMAWVKAQNCMKHEPFMDHVELKLFELNFQTELERLRNACLDRNYHYLNVEDDILCHVPKNEESTRPKSSARLEEQVIAAAIGISFQKELEGPYPEVSYSYRLAPQNNEFLYHYWFDSYRLYHADIVKRLGEKKVCVTDIKSFYPNINQLTLTAILRKRLAPSPRCYEMLSKIVVRDCHLQTCYPSHPPNYGLLQGHALSGLLANVMLQPVDEQLIQQHGLKERYHRYTDDIAVTGVENTTTSDSVEEIRQIQKALFRHDKALQLHGNEGKTHLYETPREFTRTSSRDTHLNDLSLRFNSLFTPLFVMTIPYQWEFRRSGWAFVAEYQHLLAGLGITFSPTWLFRKLDEFSRPKKWLRSYGKLFRNQRRLRFPAFPLDFNDAAQEEWLDTFKRANSSWFNEKNAVHKTLTATCKIAARSLLKEQSEHKDLTRHVRRVKFSLYRLRVFGIDELVPQVTALLLSEPWNVPVKLVCRELAQAQSESELFQVLKQSPFPYVRAMALRALGSLASERSIARLASTLDSSNERIEKLMASEALLEADIWQGIAYDRILQWLEQEIAEPYIHKNIVLMLAQAYPEQVRPILRKLDTESLHLIVHRAIHYALTKPPQENLLLRPEPEVFRKYRAKSYPVIEDLVEEEGSYRCVS